jgi:hypothetical protein
MNLGRRDRDQGEARSLLPDSKDSASEKWMRHYIINNSRHGRYGCDDCYVGEAGEISYFCPEGLRLREAALAEMKAIPKPPKKDPHHSVFNPKVRRA